MAASELGVEEGAPVLRRNGDDRIQTPDAVARAVVERFLPCGRIVEPSSGNGAFLRALPKGADWYEIQNGRDFLKAEGRWDWAVGNPPRKWTVEASRKSKRHRGALGRGKAAGGWLNGLARHPDTSPIYGLTPSNQPNLWSDPIEALPSVEGRLGRPEFPATPVGAHRCCARWDGDADRPEFQ